MKRIIIILFVLFAGSSFGFSNFGKAANILGSSELCSSSNFDLQMFADSGGTISGIKYNMRAGRFFDSSTGKFVSKNNVFSRLKTSENEAYFWSGRTGTFGGEKDAWAIAESRGGVTLEKLLKDRNIQMPDWDPSNTKVVKLFEDVSEAYANQTSGKVFGVIGEKLRPNNIWEGKELPRLKLNPNVYEINQIDPETLVEKSIYNK